MFTTKKKTWHVKVIDGQGQTLLITWRGNGHYVMLSQPGVGSEDSRLG